MMLVYLLTFTYFKLTQSANLHPFNIKNRKITLSPRGVITQMGGGENLHPQGCKNIPGRGGMINKIPETSLGFKTKDQQSFKKLIK